MRLVAQDELPPPAGPALNAANGTEQERPRPAPPAELPDAQDDIAAPQYDTPVPPAADYQAYLGLTLDPRFRNEAIAQVVAPGSPAEQAGLQPGDTVEAINGRRVSSYDDVLNFIDAMQPGDRVEIDYSRRIRVRTQAVLDGRPAERRPTARFTPDRDVDAARYDATVPQQPEQLPTPSGFDVRAGMDAPQYAPPNQRYNPAALRRYDDRREDVRRAEENRREPPREGLRGLFGRRNRDRPLLPWRRN